MRPRVLLFTVVCYCFVLSFGVNAQQTKQSTTAKREPLFIPPSAGWKVTAKDTGGAYSVVETIVQPGTGPVPHRHSREDECFYVLEGQYEFRVGDRIISASTGSFLFAPRGIPHTYKNVGTAASKHLTIISPAGLEKFFEERNALQKELPTTDPSYPGRDKALSEKYDLEYNPDWSFPPKAKD